MPPKEHEARRARDDDGRERIELDVPFYGSMVIVRVHPGTGEFSAQLAKLKKGPSQ